MQPKLTVKKLQTEAAFFSDLESKYNEPSIYGVTDGKAIGTYFEHKFKAYLRDKYTFIEGGTAKGIDFPGLLIDMKVTSINQPQSSSPFESARQKIFGLGYSLLVFVYEKTDDEKNQTGNLYIRHCIFIEKNRTADFQTTNGIIRIIENEGNLDDIVAFIFDRNLPVDDIVANTIAEEVLRKPPEIGYITISNALQWRLQYRRAIEKAGLVNGVIRLR